MEGLEMLVVSAEDLSSVPSIHFRPLNRLFSISKGISPLYPGGAPVHLCTYRLLPYTQLKQNPLKILNKFKIHV